MLLSNIKIEIIPGRPLKTEDIRQPKNNSKF
jgi:hypothetical protein